MLQLLDEVWDIQVNCDHTGGRALAAAGLIRAASRAASDLSRDLRSCFRNQRKREHVKHRYSDTAVQNQAVLDSAERERLSAVVQLMKAIVGVDRLVLPSSSYVVIVDCMAANRTTLILTTKVTLQNQSSTSVIVPEYVVAPGSRVRFPSH